MWQTDQTSQVVRNHDHEADTTANNHDATNIED